MCLLKHPPISSNCLNMHASLYRYRIGSMYLLSHSLDVSCHAPRDVHHHHHHHLGGKACSFEHLIHPQIAGLCQMWQMQGQQFAGARAGGVSAQCSQLFLNLPNNIGRMDCSCVLAGGTPPQLYRTTVSASNVN